MSVILNGEFKKCKHGANQTGTERTISRVFLEGHLIDEYTINYLKSLELSCIKFLHLPRQCLYRLFQTINEIQGNSIAILATSASSGSPGCFEPTVFQQRSPLPRNQHNIPDWCQCVSWIILEVKSNSFFVTPVWNKRCSKQTSIIYVPAFHSTLLSFAIFEYWLDHHQFWFFSLFGYLLFYIL